MRDAGVGFLSGAGMLLLLDAILLAILGMSGEPPARAFLLANLPGMPWVLVCAGAPPMGEAETNPALDAVLFTIWVVGAGIGWGVIGAVIGWEVGQLRASNRPSPPYQADEASPAGRVKTYSRFHWPVAL